MLEEMAADGHAGIVSWQPHGKAFRVHRPDAFASIIMPRYFKKQTKYKSFQRQLNLYGFHRIGKGKKDEGAYFHSRFIRNQKSMSLQMSYQKGKAKNKSAHDALDHLDAAAGDDPDFYTSERKGGNSLKNVLHADPILLEASIPYTNENKKRDCINKRFTARSSHNHAEEDSPLLSSLEEPLLFNQGVLSSAAPSPPRQLTDWMEQAQIRFSCDGEQAPPCHRPDSSVPGKSKDAAALLLMRVKNHQKYHDAGFFEGKRFFDVAETPAMMVQGFSAVVNRTWPMFDMPRSA